MRLWAALLAACLWAGTAVATPPNEILKAEFTEPTRRYDHGVLGDAVEWGAMHVVFDACFHCLNGPVILERTIRLPDNRVFEDVAPRIVRDEFGLTSILVVESDLELGARLALYMADRLEQATPFIGRSHRWLAPVGVADLDGDGIPEIAYVETPHLGRELKILRWTEDALTPVASLRGLSNHRIGDDFISGGIRDCGNGPEIITADGGWQRIMASTFDGHKVRTRPLGPYNGQKSMTAAMACVQ